jgi:NAD(P)-dependent dehydrogenase (short-subunit alcohol dehydrogenase family)
MSNDALANKSGAGRLAGKVAVVVGAGQSANAGPDDHTVGNGRAVAMLFAREGARVLAVDRDPDSLRETEALIVQAGGSVQTLVADITDEEQVEEIAPACIDAFGSIDILHNNVGIGTGDGGVTKLDREVWENIFEVNVTGMYLTCKHVIPTMRAGGGGAIVNVSSIAAVATAGIAAYKSSKAAVNALTQHLAAANFRHGIRVNAVMPGLMDTPMAIGGHSSALDVDPEDMRRKRNNIVPLGKQQGTGWDTAYAALFLASEEARFITGVLLAVDGGQTARIG